MFKYVACGMSETAVPYIVFADNIIKLRRRPEILYSALNYNFLRKQHKMADNDVSATYIVYWFYTAGAASAPPKKEVIASTTIWNTSFTA